MVAFWIGELATPVPAQSTTSPRFWLEQSSYFIKLQVVSLCFLAAKVYALIVCEAKKCDQ